MKYIIFTSCLMMLIVGNVSIGNQHNKSITYAEAQTVSTNPPPTVPDQPVPTPGGTRPPVQNNQTRLFNPLKVTSVTGVVDLIIGIVLRIAFIIAVLAIMYSGFLFVKAQGNEQEITKAKEVFWNTVIGVALIFGASGLVKIIQVTLDAIRV